MSAAQTRFRGEPTDPAIFTIRHSIIKVHSVWHGLANKNIESLLRGTFQTSERETSKLCSVAAFGHGFWALHNSAPQLVKQERDGHRDSVPRRDLGNVKKNVLDNIENLLTMHTALMRSMSKSVSNWDLTWLTRTPYVVLIILKLRKSDNLLVMVLC